MRLGIYLIMTILATGSLAQSLVQLGQYESFTVCDDYVILQSYDSITLNRILISDFSESLVSEDHTSEGFILGLENGDLLNIFRLDPGYAGDHVGNNAMLVKRTSSDQGLTWSEPEVIYNDSLYDDRNMIGGLIGKDSIIVFFRKYNAYNFPVHVGSYYFYSFDGGETWTEPILFQTNLHNHAYTTSKMIHVPTRGYLIALYMQHYVEIRFSHDGFNWDTVNYVWDYRHNFQYRISEVSFAYVGEGKILGLMRNCRPGLGQNYFFVYSEDYGHSWTEPLITNLAFPFNCPAPLIFYDEDYDDVWTIVTDRRSSALGISAYEESLWIYRNKADELIENSQNFNLIKRIQRPIPSGFRFYGYPAQMKLDRDKYLILFTESYLKANGKEGAYLYQFTLEYDSVTLPIEQFIWNNGLSSNYIEVFESGEYSVEMIDLDGNIYFETIFINIDNYPLSVFNSDTIYASSGYVFLDAGNEGKNFLWSTGEISSTILVYEEGLYTVTITNACNDSIVDSVFVIIDIVDKYSTLDNTGIDIFPNPATNYININFNKAIISEISIFNLNGSFIESVDISNQRIDVSHLPQGIYIIEIEIENEIFREKLVKQ